MQKETLTFKSSVALDNNPIFGSSLLQVYVDDIFDGVSEKTVGLDDLLDKIGGLHAPSAKSSIKKKIA